MNNDPLPTEARRILMCCAMQHSLIKCLSPKFAQHLSRMKTGLVQHEAQQGTRHDP